jgi:DNA processing protein
MMVATACEVVRLGRDDAAYPARLRDLPEPPAAVWVRGALPSANEKAVAIVGTREPTAYGQRVARELAAAYARAGVVVVSGLARGIDAAAHRGALDAGGRTVGVVGGGPDVAYPRGHRALQDAVAASGGVLSEWAPGTEARPWAFPRRNAFIAALADVVVVVEAGHKSGAHGTVEHADRIGRIFAAVPGAIDSPQSAGTNRLLRDGAQVVASLDDALALVGATPRRDPERTPDDLSPEAAACWQALGARAMDVEGVVQVTGLAWRTAVTAVSLLEVRGLVTADVMGVYRRRL